MAAVGDISPVSGEGVSFPFLDPKSWDLQFGDDTGRIVFPGTNSIKVDITNLTREMKFDIKDASGKDGASINAQGFKLATFSIVLTAFDQVGTDYIAAMLSLVEPRTGDRTVAFAVRHPALTLRRITKCYVTGIDGPEFASQLLTLSIKCVEYAPPRKLAKSVTKPVTVTPPPDAYSSSLAHRKNVDGTYDISPKHAAGSASALIPPSTAVTAPKG